MESLSGRLRPLYFKGNRSGVTPSFVDSALFRHFHLLCNMSSVLNSILDLGQLQRAPVAPNVTSTPLAPPSPQHSQDPHSDSHPSDNDNDDNDDNEEEEEEPQNP